LAFFTTTLNNIDDIKMKEYGDALLVKETDKQVIKGMQLVQRYLRNYSWDSYFIRRPSYIIVLDDLGESPIFRKF
jgi:hypothetical protein